MATTIAYDPRFNQVQSITDAMNHAWITEYDPGGRIARTSDPEGVSTSFVTDDAGRVTRVTNALHDTWQFNYNGADRTSTSNPLGAVWNQFVDDGGRVLTNSDPVGRVTRTAYDARNRITSVVDPAGGEIRFSYDANGRITLLADPLDHATSYEWDANNRLTARVDALQNAERYEYDVLGNLTAVLDRNGQTTRYRYDPHNGLAFVTYADGSTTEYVYDAVDRLLRIVDSVGGTIEREYDSLDRLVSESTPEGIVRYTYDADGRRTSMTATGQTPVTYEYDAAHRLTSVVQGDAIVAIGYDDAGGRRTVRLPNGIVATYGYDAAGQVVSIAYGDGAVLVGDLTYTYDAAGNRTSVGGSLASSGMPSEVLTAEYDAANRLTSWNGRQLGYDANGNVTSDGSTTYTWDARNQLSAIVGPSSSAFEYDGAGRRRGRVAGSHLRYQYDGVNVIAELAGGVAAATLLTGGIDEIFQRVDAGGARSVFTDALGSTVALADASGTLSTRYAYDPFGATTVSGGASSNSAQFTGREAEANGLYFSRARYYDPNRGRFLSEDPIGAFGGPNAYAYVGGMPTRFTDPFGLYNRDVHYDLTRAIAEQVGMCAADAEMIAAADQWVDDDRRSSPMPPANVGARQSFHFTDFERRQELRRGAFRTGSRLEMGAYLHALQDSFSHQQGRKDRDGEPFGPWWGHLFRWHGPDDPRSRPVLWRRMAATTASELLEFRRLYPGCGR